MRSELTAHELARLLLAGPDVPVITGSRDGWNDASSPEEQIARNEGAGVAEGIRAGRRGADAGAVGQG